MCHSHFCAACFPRRWSHWLQEMMLGILIDWTLSGLDIWPNDWFFELPAHSIPFWSESELNSSSLCKLDQKTRPSVGILWFRVRTLSVTLFQYDFKAFNPFFNQVRPDQLTSSSQNFFLVFFSKVSHFTPLCRRKGVRKNGTTQSIAIKAISKRLHPNLHRSWDDL